MLSNRPSRGGLTRGVPNTHQRLSCTKLVHADLDGDGWCAVPAAVIDLNKHICEGASGFGDCDDGTASVRPGALEACDDLDNDCDGDVDEEDACADDTDVTPPDGEDCFDLDGDGVEDCDGDCDDADASVYPGAAEVDGDDVDSNCDGLMSVSPDADNDGDGISNAEEELTLGSNPDAPDSDGDGYGDALEVANGSSPTDAGSPFSAGSGDHFTQLVAGVDYVCGLRTDGTVTCWGGDSVGRASCCCLTISIRGGA